jgi:hypothetical protein
MRYSRDLKGPSEKKDLTTKINVTISLGETLRFVRGLARDMKLEYGFRSLETRSPDSESEFGTNPDIPTSGDNGMSGAIFLLFTVKFVHEYFVVNFLEPPFGGPEHWGG